MKWLPAQRRSFLNLPSFLDLNGSIIYLRYDLENFFI